MPPTLRHSNNALGIDLEGPRQAFGPGDTIVGRVWRRVPVVTPQASVRITLHGRTKSKLVISRGNSSSTYRGRFTVIDGRQNTQVLFKGPLHVADVNDLHQWPFAVTIPTQIDPGVSRCNQDTFIPTDNATVSQTPLPPTFQGQGFTGSTEGFVEYWLEATLHYSGKKDRDTVTATYPFDLRTYRPEPPIVDNQLKRHKSLRSVNSQRLIPGMEDAELTKSQKMKKFFHTSSVPEFWFNLEIDAPYLIQLENENPISFMLRINPLWDRTSEVIRNVPQKLKLTEFILKIRQIALVKCEGSWRTYQDDFENKSSVSFDRAIKRLEKPIEIPVVEGGTPIDLGKLLNIRIGHRGAIGEMNPGFMRLTQQFTTWNILVAHTFGWILKFEIAGEELEFRSQRDIPLHLLGPSDMNGGQPFEAPPLPVSQSWIHPPDDVEAPPSFDQVQSEDKKEALHNLSSLENGGPAMPEKKG